MKKIEAFIRPHRLNSLKDRLAKEHYPALTAYEVRGRGKQSGLIQTMNGQDMYVDLMPKTKVELVINDEDVERAVEIISEVGWTGAIGDGKIFISTVDEVIQIRTGLRGKEAI
ncbi:MAG: transcriptional regulator [Chloroflexi bacterium RBG_13_56_8]|nr:MAG: transcriptional regulator [Chloroflexi bacterium RBG_13_56_8]